MIRQLILGCSAAILAGTLSASAFAVIEKNDGTPGMAISKRPAFPAENFDTPQMQEEARIQRLSTVVQDKNMPASKRLEAAKALPAGNLRDEVCLSIALDGQLSGFSGIDDRGSIRLEAAAALPAGALLDLAYLSILQDGNLDTVDRIIAAQRLPKENPSRNQFLRSIAEDKTEYFLTRLDAATNLPENDPVRAAILKEFE